MALLVGRDSEVRHLQAAMQRAHQNVSSLTVLEGEPGIGKTRLLLELEDLARADGWAVFCCRCSELETERPFAPVAAGLVELVSALGDAVPFELAEALGLLRETELHATPLENQGQRLGRLILEGIHDLSRSRPVLVLFDDTHWIDEASADVLWRIARHRAKPVLTVASFRTSARDVVQTLRRGLDASGAANLALRPLKRDQSEQLATHLLGGSPAGVVARLLDDAAGNPLFITELVRGSGESAESDGPSDRQPIPTSLRRLVLGRMQALHPDAQAALDDASLLGLSFDPRELAAIRGVADMALFAVLELAVELGIVIDHPPRLAFQHAIVQKIVADRLPEAFRIARHGELAGLLRANGARATRVAEHLLLSKPVPSPGAAAIYAAAAAEVRPLSLEASLVWLERASDATIEDELRFRLRCECAEVLVLIGRIPDAERICESLWPKVEAPEQETRLRVVLAALTTMAGRTRADEAAAHLERVLEILPPGNPGRIEMLGWRAVLHVFGGDLDEAERVAQFALATETGDLDARACRANEALSLVSLLRGDTRLAVVHAERALELFSAQENVFTWLMMPHFAHGMALIGMVPIDAVIDAIQAGFEVCERAGHGLARLHLEPIMALAHFVRGDLSIARAAVTSIVESNNDWRRGGIALPTATALAAYLTLLDDNLAGAVTLAEQALQELLGGGAQAGSADVAAWCIACVREAAGDVEGARDLLVGVWELIGKNASLYNVAPDLVRLTRDTRPDFALDVVLLAEARAARSGVALDRAHALASRGFFEWDPDLLEQAALAWEELDWLLTPTRTREFALVMSVGAPAQERRDRVAIITQGWERMEARRPLRLLDETTRRDGRREKRAPRPVHGPESLTQTERAVVRLVAEGLTNKEIAQRLYVSHRTIDTHVSHALSKLGVSSRVGLVRVLGHSDT